MDISTNQRLMLSKVQQEIVNYSSWCWLFRSEFYNLRYSNAYNFVHLDLSTGNGNVFLRRWSDRRGEWIEDLDTHKDGVFSFEYQSLRKQHKILIMRKKLTNT